MIKQITVWILLTAFSLFNASCSNMTNEYGNNPQKTQTEKENAKETITNTVNDLLNNDEVSEEDKQKITDIYNAYQSGGADKMLESIESAYGGDVTEEYTATLTDENGVTTELSLEDKPFVQDVPAQYYNILEKNSDGIDTKTYGIPARTYWVGEPVDGNIYHVNIKNYDDTVFMAGSMGSFILVDQNMKPIKASSVKRFLYGHTIIDGNRYRIGSWGSLATAMTNERTALRYGSFLSDTFFDELIGPAYLRYFMVISQSDTTADFETIANSKPVKKVLIYTHGTLLYNYAPFTDDINKNTQYIDKGFRNVRKSCEANGIAIDQFVELRWNGGNKDKFRRNAALKLKNAIYAITLQNLFNIQKTEFYLVSHSHGNAVSSIAINDISTGDLAMLFGSLNRLISFNGVARTEYVQKKIKQINYYMRDYEDGDGVVPRAWCDFIPFGDAEDWQSSVCAAVFAGIALLIQCCGILSSTDVSLYDFHGKSALATDVNEETLLGGKLSTDWFAKTRWRKNHEDPIKEYPNCNKIIKDAFAR